VQLPIVPGNFSVQQAQCLVTTCDVNSLLSDHSCCQSMSDHVTRGIEALPVTLAVWRTAHYWWLIRRQWRHVTDHPQCISTRSTTTTSCDRH